MLVGGLQPPDVRFQLCSGGIGRKRRDFATRREERCAIEVEDSGAHQRPTREKKGERQQHDYAAEAAQYPSQGAPGAGWAHGAAAERGDGQPGSETQQGSGEQREQGEGDEVDRDPRRPLPACRQLALRERGINAQILQLHHRSGRLRGRDRRRRVVGGGGVHERGDVGAKIKSGQGNKAAGFGRGASQVLGRSRGTALTS